MKSSNNQKTLRLAFLTEANSLDPRYGYEIPANHLIKMLFEGLMRMTPEKTLIPAACEEVEISKDQKTYTFRIRSALWSNGKPVTAHDFEYAWKWVIDPKTSSRGTSDFYPIKNVQAIVKGELPIDAAGIRCEDAKTLVVELDHPTPYFLELTSTSVYSPICNGIDRTDPLWAQKTGESFVSNGPFLLKERNPNSHLALSKNPHYWNAGQVAMDQIQIAIVNDIQTQMALFQKNQIDWFGKPFTTLPLDAIPSLRKEKILELFPEQALYWYFINTEKFPFHNTKMRRAFAYAVDRKSIVDHLLKEDEEIATGVNRNSHFFTDADLPKAKELFEEALSELKLTRETFPKIALSFCNIETNNRVACIVQQQLKEALGIEVTLDGQEWVKYYDNIVHGNFQIGGLCWHSRIRDPIYNLHLFKHKNDLLNVSRWENTRFQQLIDEAENQVDQAARDEALREAESLLMEEMPIIPVYHLTVSYAKNPLLKNVYVSEINEIDFTWTYKTAK